MWNKIKSLIGDALPTVASIASGNPLAGKAIEFLKDKFLGDDKASDAELIDKIETQMQTEEGRLLIAEMDMEMKKVMLKHEIELLESDRKITQQYLDDISNARERETSIVKATGKKDWFMYGLAALFVVGFFTVMVIAFVSDIKDSTLLNMLVGALIGNTVNVIQYFFGSSRGSSEKNAIISKMKK